MNNVAYIFRFLFRIKWWLLLLPIVAALLVYLKMGTMSRTYKSQSTVYTGVVSGYDIESNTSSKQDWNIINNAIDNLINIIKAQTTLRNVSMRLFAEHMMYGNPEKDNQYITARNYRDLVARTPKEVQELIDKDNDSLTLVRLYAYEKADHDNYVYGLFHWTHRHYSYDALSKIAVKRLSNSDMLEISYENDDPGIVYNTIRLLNEEFRNQYQELRFGETNSVIKYFEGELGRVGDSLRRMETDLKDYNVENQVINYDEQTKHIAALSRDYELRYEEILLNYKSSEALRQKIETQIDGLESFKNNAAFIQKLDNISNLQSRISATEMISNDTNETKKQDNLESLRRRLQVETSSLQQITANISTSQYTKEGVSTPSMIMQWLDATLLSTKSKTELEVMKLRKEELDQKYTIFSPVGSIIKQRQRSINFSEQSYLSVLQALNTARLRQKNLQMSSATLKVINPPVLPIGAEPSKRKLLVFGTLFGTFCFVLGFFILLELLDRTPRDKMRAERITGGRVLGAYPRANRLRHRRYAKAYSQAAAQYLCNSTLNYMQNGQQNVVNFISTEIGEGKSLLMEQLAEQLSLSGMKVRTASWNKDFNSENKTFLMAQRLTDFLPENQEGKIALSEADVVLVEYPPFCKHSVSRELLSNASLNVLVMRADRTWKDTDQLLYDKATDMAAEAPVMLYLNKAEHRVVETFTGMLPPYTPLRRLLFQFGQCGFTSSIN